MEAWSEEFSVLVPFGPMEDQQPVPWGNTGKAGFAGHSRLLSAACRHSPSLHGVSLNLLGRLFPNAAISPRVPRAEQSPAHGNGTLVPLKRNASTTATEKFRTADMFFNSPPLNLSFFHDQPLQSTDR